MAALCSRERISVRDTSVDAKSHDTRFIPPISLIGQAESDHLGRSLFSFMRYNIADRMFPLNSISIKKQAVITRRELLKTIAADGSLAAGMHLPFPGIGHIRVEGNGSYAWVPVEFGPMPEEHVPAAKKSY